MEAKKVQKNFAFIFLGLMIGSLIPISDFIFTPEHISLSNVGLFSYILRFLIALIFGIYFYFNYKTKEKYEDLEDLGKKNESIIKFQKGKIIKIK